MGESNDNKDLEVFVKREDGTELCRTNLALSILLKESVLFANERKTLFQGEEGESTVVLYVLCNELFCKTSADAEPLKYDDIGSLYKIFIEHGHLGKEKWCCLQRGETPIEEVVQQMKDANIWDNVMDNLKPNESEANS